jgi:hypothetical protein
MGSIAIQKLKGQLVVVLWAARNTSKVRVLQPQVCFDDFRRSQKPQDSDIALLRIHRSASEKQQAESFNDWV